MQAGIIAGMRRSAKAQGIVPKKQPTPAAASRLVIAATGKRTFL